MAKKTKIDEALWVRVFDLEQRVKELQDKKIKNLQEEIKQIRENRAEAVFSVFLYVFLCISYVDSNNYGMTKV